MNRQRAKKDDTEGARIQVQSRVKKSVYEFIKSEKKKRKLTTLSETIDVLLYDLMTQ